MNIKSIASNLGIPLGLFTGLCAVSFSVIFIEWSTAPSAIIGMYRLWISTVALLPLAIRQWRDMLRLSLRDIALLTLAGIFLGLHFLFWIQSLKETSVASSMIIISLEPIFVMIGAYFLFHESIRKVGILCMGVAIAGCFIVAISDLGRSGGGHLAGDILSLIGTAAVSVYMLAGQSVRKTVSSSIYNVFVFFIAGLVLFLYNVGAHIQMTHYSAENWTMFALLAFVSTILGHGVFNSLLDRVAAMTVATVILCEPVAAIVLAFFLLNQPIHLLKAVGGLMSIAGVFWFLRVNRSKKTNNKQNPASEETQAADWCNHTESLDARGAQEI